MMKFILNSPFLPTGDQPEAIELLNQSLTAKSHDVVLLGVTGSGKTFTIANTIAKLQLPTLVISHNKTLAAQLYQEFKSFFPQNAISYFVSYYDYYQPEAYIPQTDTYIEKETDINDEINKLRLAATTNILTRKDTIVIASVSCIYNLGSPEEYGSFILEIRVGTQVSQEQIIKRLVEMQYLRSEYGFYRGTFRIRGDKIDIFPAYTDTGIRFEFLNNRVKLISQIDPITGKTISALELYVLYPAKHYVTDVYKQKNIFNQIETDLQIQVAKFKQQGKLLEAQRLQQKVNYDLEMIKEVGFVNGIENYSRYFDGRKPGDSPFTLMEYFQKAYGKDWLLVIDESHMTLPQIRGMYFGDLSRKTTLVNYGFRLPAALDNRPLRFDEFLRRIPQAIYVSATPNEYEISKSKIWSTGKLKNGIVEQLIRPTGIIDPQITVKPSNNQINDLILQIRKRVAKKERILVTTLTKRMAEDLTSYLKEQNINVEYLHSDIKTLERTDVLDNLRRGKYDVIVGINLLREGLDLPEVSLVAILDADKEGFLRSDVALIQTMGRAARHIQGDIIMYADKVTGSMQRAIDEVNRRREIQKSYNQKNHISPQNIHKPFRENFSKFEKTADPILSQLQSSNPIYRKLKIDNDSLTLSDKLDLVKNLEKEMKIAAHNLEFELAAQIRDKIFDLKKQ